MAAKGLSVESAQTLILSRALPLGDLEELPLADAHRRFLAQAVHAPLNLPPFSNSAMDGFAVRSADVPGTLAIIGESAAGSPFGGAIGAGEAVRISTGAVIPDGADCVAIIERVSVDGSALTVSDEIQPMTHVRLAGSDAAAGQLVLSAGTQLRSAQIGAAAALGVASLKCHRRPTVAIVATGSELAAAGTPLEPGQIYESNGQMLAALVADAGGVPVRLPPPADERGAVHEALTQALASDVVISTGGVSVGPHDIVRSVSAELGVQELFWGVRMRPGKPLSFAVKGESLIFGIPGNPVSALVCFEMFVRPALRALQGAARTLPPFQTRLLAADVERNPERDDLIRVRVDDAGHLVPLLGQMSHQLTVSAAADGLARIQAGEGVVNAQTPVAYLDLSG